MHMQSEFPYQRFRVKLIVQPRNQKVLRQASVSRESGAGAHLMCPAYRNPATDRKKSVMWSLGN